MTGRARQVVVAVLLGTLLNPLNSSMIAVALVPLRHDFGTTLGTVTWLISGFYLAGAVGQPLMGRLAEHFGPRRVFLLGLALTGLLSALAPLAPSIGWLIAVRVLLAFGTSTPYPAGLALIRSVSERGRTPAGALGALSVAGSLSAALGPALGGLLLIAVGWRGIFLVNVPLTLLGIGLGLRWLPAPPASAPAARGGLDLLGAGLFAATLVALLGFLLSIQSGPRWPLLLAVPAAAGLLVLRERSVEQPFFDLQTLAANRRLLTVFVQFAAVNLVFYSVFFGLPIWLEQTRGFDARSAGLLMLPITGMGVLTILPASRVIARSGPRSSLVLGSVLLMAGSLLLLTFGDRASALLILAAAFVIGVPNGLNNLGLQAAMYEATPAARTASAGGQFQTFRYVGAILSSSLLGVLFGDRASTGDLHRVAVAIAAIAALLVAVNLLTSRPRQPGVSG